jgi:pyruvate/2-oxoglutarate dehydrogenase complex dihydrolipoamide acyltransferase (E2) component
MHARALIIGLALTSPIATGAAAEEQRPAQPPAAAPQQQQMPVSLEQALYLIRSTLLTLNDANRTGNYTVLRELAAPDFQAANTAADLAQNFADLRRRKFDLFTVALAAPQLTAAPALDGNGMLRLTGLFPTRPLQINFDLLFQNSGGQWRLFGISVATPQAAAQPQPPAETPNTAPPNGPAKNAPPKGTSKSK